MDRMDERNRYEEIIRQNLELRPSLSGAKVRQRPLPRDDQHHAGCRLLHRSDIRINGEDMPQQVVKSRFLKLNSSHIEYVFEVMNKNPSDIRNIKAYLLTALYNASLTIDNYYSASSTHDFHGQDYSYDEYCL